MPLLALLIFAITRAYLSIKRQVCNLACGQALLLDAVHLSQKVDTLFNLSYFSVSKYPAVSMHWPGTQ